MHTRTTASNLENSAVSRLGFQNCCAEGLEGDPATLRGGLLHHLGHLGTDAEIDLGGMRDLLQGMPMKEKGVGGESLQTTRQK